MPRLRQVSRAQASESVQIAYDTIFGDRDPVEEPGTSTGTPGNWWSTMALSPFVFAHATFSSAMVESSVELDPELRELAIMRTGFNLSSLFVYSQHCKAARHIGVNEEKIAAIPHWQLASAYTERERTVLAWTDGLTLQGGRISDEVFEAVQGHLDDAEILELTYRAMTYHLHAVTCKALRLEYDDVGEAIVEVPKPEQGPLADWMKHRIEHETEQAKR